MSRRPGDEPIQEIEINALGEAWRKLPGEDSGWLDLGIAPTPRNKSGWFKYHVLHGLLMEYSLWAVLVFAVRAHFATSVVIEVTPDNI